MDYDILYVNGDSYSSENWWMTNNKPLVWADHLAKKLNLHLCNSAKVGSSNTRILRSSLIDITNLLNSGRNPLVLIGLSFIRRQEVWEENIFADDRDYPFNKNGGMYGPTTLDQAVKREKGHRLDYYKTRIMNEEIDIPNVVLNFYTSLFLFVNWMKNHNINFFIFSAAQNCFESPEHYTFLKEVNFFNFLEETPCIDSLHNFCFNDWALEFDKDAKDSGHLSENGHAKMADFLHKKLIDKSIINFEK